MARTATMRFVLRISSAWCIGGYVRTIRPLSFVSSAARAKHFPTRQAARQYARHLPQYIATFAPPTTFVVERLSK